MRGWMREISDGYKGRERKGEQEEGINTEGNKVTEGRKRGIVEGKRKQGTAKEERHE